MIEPCHSYAKVKAQCTTLCSCSCLGFACLTSGSSIITQQAEPGPATAQQGLTPHGSFSEPRNYR